MLELLLFWKLNDIREELVDYDTEETIGAVAIFVMAQVITWPLLLGVAVGKKFGWIHGTLLASAVTTLSLVFNWGFYFILGFVAAVITAGVIAWYLTFAEE